MELWKRGQNYQKLNCQNVVPAFLGDDLITRLAVDSLELCGQFGYIHSLQYFLLFHPIWTSSC